MICRTTLRVVASIFLSVALSTLVAPPKVIGGVISQKVLTANRLEWIESRIQDYAAEHHSLPKKLADLPVWTDHDNGLTDGWDKPIVYSPQKDGSVILTSLGQDEKTDVRSVRFSIIPDEERLKEQDTFININFDEKFIRDYAKIHSRLPANFSDRPDGEKGETGFDGWGKPIEYKATANGTVTLTSHGKTGKQIFSTEFLVPIGKN